MINKKNIWFLTLFSLILVLSVYYITMPNELLVNNLENIETKETEKVSSKEETVITTLKLQNEEEHLEQLDSLKLILTNQKSTVEEKNEAFDKMKSLDINKAEEENLMEKVKKELKLDSFIKIDGNNIKVIIKNDKEDTKLANDIMRFIQKNYETKKYITVEFK